MVMNVDIYLKSLTSNAQLGNRNFEECQINYKGYGKEKRASCN